MGKILALLKANLVVILFGNVMRRNRQAFFKEQQGTERWLLSYADFITLLFAFFVVMYSISQVSESKYKILSSSLDKAFDVPQKSILPIQIGEIDHNEKFFGTNAKDQLNQDADADADTDATSDLESDDTMSNENFAKLKESLSTALDDLVKQDLAEITSNLDWVNINLRSGLLFSSGSDEFNISAEPLLQEVVKHLNSNNQQVIVHGHTDNIPINTTKFPSNWELSSARAVAVVRKLQILSVYAPRMSVEGHAEFHPIASNDTVEGRAKNRRVVISISRKHQALEGTLLIDGKETSKLEMADQEQALQQKESEPEFVIIRLPGGGILIRGKELPQDKSNK